VGFSLQPGPLSSTPGRREATAPGWVYGSRAGSGARRAEDREASVQLPHAVLVERLALLVAIENENRDFILFLELEIIRHANLLEKGPRSREMAGPAFSTATASPSRGSGLRSRPARANVQASRRRPGRHPDSWSAGSPVPRSFPRRCSIRGCRCFGTPS
jgi:hypothetical protein